MQKNFYQIGEELVTSSGIALTNVLINGIVHVEKLVEHGTISLDIPGYVSAQTFSDGSDPLFFRKVGTLNKVGGISDYTLTEAQKGQMNLLTGEYQEVVKAAIADTFGVNVANITVVSLTV